MCFVQVKCWNCELSLEHELGQKIQMEAIIWFNEVWRKLLGCLVENADIGQENLKEEKTIVISEWSQTHDIQ